MDQNGISYLENKMRYEGKDKEVERGLIYNLAEFLFSKCRERTAQGIDMLI